MLPQNTAQPNTTQPAQRRDYNQQPIGQQDMDQLKAVKVNAIKMIHGDSADRVLGMIDPQKGRNPVEQIADLSIMLLDRIEQQANKDGQQIDDFVKIQGGNIIVNELIEAAQASGKIPEMNEDEKALTLSVAVQKYADRMVANGEISREELKQYANQAMSVGNKNGTLNMDKVMGGINGQTPPQQPVSAPTAQPAQPKEDPFNPSMTMTQQLRQGRGLLDG